MKKDPLESTPDDEIHALVKGTIGAVPIIGPLASEMFQRVVADPGTKRRDNFIRDIFARLGQLEVKIEDLENNVQFQSSLLTAIQMSIRISDEEKIEALKNAVVNTAVATGLDDSVRHIFLNCIDQMTPMHIRLLIFLHDPRAIPSVAGRLQNLMSGGVDQLIPIAVPELKNQGDLAKLVINDLQRMGFVSNFEPSAMMSSSGLEASRTTALGKNFLIFIRVNGG